MEQDKSTPFSTEPEVVQKKFDDALMAGASREELAFFSEKLGRQGIAGVPGVGDYVDTIEVDQFIDDDTPSVQPKKLTNGDRTVGAYLALNRPDTGAVYQNAMLDAEAGLDRTRKEVMSGVQSELAAASTTDIQNILLDDSLTDEQKTVAIRSAQELPTEREAAQYKLLALPNGGETEDDEAQRIDFASAIKEANAYNDWKQKVLNASAANMSFEGLAGYKDVVLSFTPYVRELISDDVVERMEETGYIGPEAASNFFLFAGSNNKAIRDALNKMSFEERKRVTGGILKIMEDESSILFSDTIQSAKLDMIRTFLENDYYTDTDVWVDNAFGFLDLAFFGFSDAIRNTGKRLMGFTKSAVTEGLSAADLLSRSRRNSVKGANQPAAPMDTTKTANPSVARGVDKAIDTDEEMAKAGYGTNQTDAVADSNLPDVLDDHGVTRNKPKSQDDIEDEILDILENREGRLELTEGELEQAYKSYSDRFTRASYMVNRPAQGQAGKNLGNGKFRLSQVFGQTTDAGFKSFQEAMEVAVDHARRYGLTSDSITIQAKSYNGEYHDVTGKMVAEAANITNGDFLIKFDFDYNVSPVDISQWEKAGVNQKLFGFIPLDQLATGATRGKLTRWFKDAQATLDGVLSKSGLRVEDRASRIQQLLTEDLADFEKKVAGLDVGEQEKMLATLKKANDEGITYTPEMLKAEGFSSEAIDAMKDFRRFWDREWRLNNYARRKQLHDEGYMVLEDLENGTKFYAKREAAVLADPDRKRVDVFDLSENDFVTLDLSEGAAGVIKGDKVLYTLAEPIEVEGRKIRYAYGSEQKHERVINSSDNIVPYRQGYYKVNYEGKYFIERVEKDARGNVIGRSVVAATDSPSSAISAERRMQQEYDARSAESADYNDMTSVEYAARVDLKDKDEVSRLVESTSRKADGFRQHFRGERLGDAENPMLLDAAIQDPVGVMTRAVGATSRRLAYHNWITAAKERFLRQYESLLPDGVFPSSVDKIKDSGRLKDKKLLSDALVTWEYINFMENIQLNAASQAYKSFWKNMEELFGEMAESGSKLGKAGEIVSKNLGNLKPVEASKKVAFEAAIVFNPARQLTLGVADLLTKMPMFAGSATAGIRDGAALVAAVMMEGSTNKAIRDQWSKVMKISSKSQAEINQMLKHFRDSGLVSAVDKQALMQAGLHTELERTTLATSKLQRGMRKAGNAYEKVRGVFYKTGFQANEFMTQGVLWSAGYNALLKRIAKEGRKAPTARELDDLAAQIRNMNYGQNRAGELKYNTSVFGVLMQFMQIVHKAISLVAPKQLGGNALITGKQKALLMGSALTLYGTPEDFFGMKLTRGLTEEIEDDTVRNTIDHGLAWLTFYNLFDASVSTRELSPFDPEAIIEKFGSIAGGTFFTDSPSAQFAWPRVVEAMRHTSSVWGKGFDDYSTVDKFGSIASKWAQISSGFSNFTKAKYALEHQKFVSSKGWISDDHVTGSEAIMKALGFRTLDEQEVYDTQQNLKKLKKLAMDDVKKWYDSYKQDRLSLGDDQQSIQFIERSYAEFWRVYRETDAYPFMQAELKRLVRMDVSQGDTRFALGIMSTLNMIPPEEIANMVRTSGLDEEKQQQLLQALKDVNNIKNYRGDE